jgi:hypothetical protein
MKLGLGALAVMAMVAGAAAVTGCKSSNDQPADDTPTQAPSAVPATGDPSAQPGGDDDRAARRSRRHHGRGRGHGEWRKRRAAAQPPASDAPALPPQ